MVIASDNTTEDTYLLTIKEDTITQDYTCWNGHHQERKSIHFDNERRTITTIETTNYVKGNTNKPCGSEKKITIEEYKENELIYRKTFESKTETNLKDTTSQTLVCETFINAKKEAVQRTIAVGDENAFYPTGITYYKTSHIEEPPFNTTEVDRRIYINRMTTASQEEFDSFVDSLEKNDYPTLKKK